MHRTAALLLTLPFLLAPARAAEPEGPRVFLEGGSWLAGEVEGVEPVESPWRKPFGLAFDGNNTAWLVEYEVGRLWKRSGGASEWELFAGAEEEGYSGDGGPASAARFRKMHNVAATPSGDLYISDTSNHAVRKIEGATGNISTLAGNGKAGFAGDGGPASAAQFNLPICVSLDPACEALYIADINNKRIRKIELASGNISTVAGNGKAGVPEEGALATESPLADPRAAAVDAAGNLYILERGGHALRVVDAAGKIRTVIGDGKAGANDGPARAARLKAPKHICLDSQGRVLIADEGNHAIRRYDPATETVETLLGSRRGHPAITLKSPHGVTVHEGKLYVVDSYHDRLLRVEE